MRSCPICFSIDRTPIFASSLTCGDTQTILVCNDCGMVYASVERGVDYDKESIYSLPGAIGSGESPFDKQRLKGVSYLLASLEIPYDASILDIGCAQGGLLTALRDLGFTNLYGIDPSQHCVDATARKGFNASIGYLGSRHTPKADLTTLSHVLEHVEDVRGALKSIQSPLLYVEVPDASRYAEFENPFLDFNSEHINHFSLPHLLAALEYEGFHILHAGRRIMPLTSGRPYPAIWVLAQRSPSLKASIDTYIKKSQAELARMDDFIGRSLPASATECAIWGAGEYMTFIASLPIFRQVKIVQVVDRNPALQGKVACGVRVELPYQVRPNLPIVIASLVAKESIKRDIKSMNLPNQVITIL